MPAGSAEIGKVKLCRPIYNFFCLKFVSNILAFSINY